MQGVDDMVFFTDDAGMKWSGVGWVGSICGGNHFIRNMCNLNVYQEYAANLAGVSTGCPNKFNFIHFTAFHRIYEWSAP